MNEKPILFSGEMVRAILDGRKTVTRRVMKPQPNLADGKWRFNGRTWEKHLGYPIGHDVPLSPYGRPGDLLWVRETWAVHCCMDAYAPSDFKSHYGQNDDYLGMKVYYKAHDYPFRLYEVKKWRPSIHMPRWASRLTLRVTAVRVERVQDISIADLIAEGVWHLPDEWGVDLGMRVMEYEEAANEWSRLWDALNKPRGYGIEANPFVWVIEFEVIK